MDTNALVEGGANGLARIVDALEAAKIIVKAAYLIQLTNEDDTSNVYFRIVTDQGVREVIHEFVRLRRDNLLPKVADEVRISPIRPNHVEAERVLRYASKFNELPVEIHGVIWDGLYIEDAVVVKLPTREHAAA